MIIKFSSKEYNIIIINNAYVLWLLTDNVGNSYLVNARCPHKGGPLFLGYCETNHIICPWHGQRISIDSLIMKAWPIIINDYDITVVSPIEGILRFINYKSCRN